MLIKFNQDYQVKAKNGPLYEKGKLLTCNNKTGLHFVHKGVADVVLEKPVKVKIENTEKPDEVEKVAEAVTEKKRGRPPKGSSSSRQDHP